MINADSMLKKRCGCWSCHKLYAIWRGSWCYALHWGIGSGLLRSLREVCRDNSEGGRSTSCWWRATGANGPSTRTGDERRRQQQPINIRRGGDEQQTTIEESISSNKMILKDSTEMTDCNLPTNYY